MLALLFHPKFMKLNTMCVTAPMFSVNVNREPKGYFTGAKALRLGDPLCPSVFVICHGSACQRASYRDKAFQFHAKVPESNWIVCLLLMMSYSSVGRMSPLFQLYELLFRNFPICLDCSLMLINQRFTLEGCLMRFSKALYGILGLSLVIFH